LPVCWAYAATENAAAPRRVAMNSRRLMGPIL
jgi:hypothetical protein